MTQPPPTALVSREDPALSAVVTSVTPLPGVRAGSALVRHSGRLLLAQDDDYTLFWIDIDMVPPGTTSLPLREGSGAMAKAEKPDFEAATALPDGRILVMGSGSAELRRSVVLLTPETGNFDLHDSGRLYDLVGEAIGHELNFEAVLPIDGGLRLFHRGNSGDGDATVDLIIDPTRPQEATVAGVVRWSLGTVPGESRDVPLTFTDADLDSHGRQWYIAAAEDTPNAIDDGPIAGSAIGLMSDSGGRWTPIREQDGSVSIRKYEGLVVDPDLTGAWLVTDPDDEHLTAELCRVDLTGWDPTDAD